MTTVTIFVNARAYDNDEHPAIGVRFETQCLPAGSYVAGWVTDGGEMLRPPCDPAYQDEWDAALIEARETVST
jgi:hypothetical protein